MRTPKGLIDLLLRRRDPERHRPVIPPEAGLDLLDPAFIADPYPFYAYLRDHAPVHRTRQGSWILTRHADVMAALNHPQLGNAPATTAVTHARNSERYVCASVAGHILPFLDRPEQLRPRRLVGSAFRTALREAAPPLDRLAAAQLAGLAGRDRFDLIADFARPLSVNVISVLMGVPAQDADDICEWADAFFHLFAPITSLAIRERTDLGLGAFRAYLQALLAERRRRPGNDVPSLLLAAADETGPLEEIEIIDNCMLLIADGIENVNRGLANIVLALLRHPSALARLRAQPELIGATVTEGLRYDPPGQAIARIARQDLDFGGQRLRKDSVVVLALGSANRDATVWSYPDRFEPRRNADLHLSFGRGRHSCLGAPLVLAELETALKALLARFTNLNLDGEQQQWEPRFGHRWLKTLPVRTSR